MSVYEGFTITLPNRDDWHLSRVLELQADRIGDRPFIQFETAREFTFSEFDVAVNRLANGMHEAGLGLGEPLVTFLPNSPEQLLCVFAAMKAGGIPAPINTEYRTKLLAHAVNKTGAVTLITNGELLEHVFAVADELVTLQTVYVVGSLEPERHPSFDVRPFAALDSDRKSVQAVPRDRSVPGLILYTSGATGPSKAVPLPHSALYFYGEELANVCRITQDDVCVNSFPLFHGNQWVVTLFPALIRGAKAVVYEKFSATGWVERMRTHGATQTSLVGVTMEWIYKQPPTDDDTTQLRVILAAPVADGIRDDFQRRFGVERILCAYGQIETCAPILTPYNAARPDGSSGKLLEEWFDVMLVDPETDEPVADGEVGELLVRPKEPWISSLTYLNDGDATAKAQRNLWWHTGDALRRDDAGWFYFIDRISDTIRVRGINVSSYDVEQAVLRHPAIETCAAIAVPAGSEASEYEVKLVLQLHDGATLHPEEIVRHCEDTLPWFAVPRYIEIVAALPQNEITRVRKMMLRAEPMNTNTFDRIARGVFLKREIKKRQGEKVGG